MVIKWKKRTAEGYSLYWQWQRKCDDHSTIQRKFEQQKYINKQHKNIDMLASLMS